MMPEQRYSTSQHSECTNSTVYILLHCTGDSKGKYFTAYIQYKVQSKFTASRLHIFIHFANLFDVKMLPKHHFLTGGIFYIELYFNIQIVMFYRFCLLFFMHLIPKMILSLNFPIQTRTTTANM